MQQARGIKITDPLNSERFMRRLTDDFFSLQSWFSQKQSPVTKVLMPPLSAEVRVVIPGFKICMEQLRVCYQRSASNSEN